MNDKVLDVDTTNVSVIKGTAWFNMKTANTNHFNTGMDNDGRPLRISSNVTNI